MVTRTVTERVDLHAEEYEGRAMRFLLAYRDVMNVALAFPSAATAITQTERFTIRA